MVGPHRSPHHHYKAIQPVPTIRPVPEAHIVTLSRDITDKVLSCKTEGKREGRVVTHVGSPSPTSFKHISAVNTMSSTKSTALFI